jgi:hypothetical protein
MTTTTAARPVQAGADFCSRILPAPLAALGLSASLLWALGAASALAGCGGGKAATKQVRLNRYGQPIKEGVPPPGWVRKIPNSSAERAVAVGFSGPTFWPQDAINNAMEDARGKLALAMSSKVERYTQVGGVSSDNALDVTKEATDVVMQNSRIDSTWVDAQGELNEAGSVWALAVLDKGAGKEHGLSEANGKNGSPGWLNRLPTSKARLYAAGYCGPTFRPEDALEYAGDQAIKNLAASLRSHVQAYNLVIATTNGQAVDDFAHAEDPEQELIDRVRKKAKVEQVWVDKEGVRPGDPPGAVWALAAIDIGSSLGGAQQQQNEDTGPALDSHGNVPK